MSRTHHRALAISAAALLVSAPLSARAQRAPLVSPMHPIAHPVFRVQQRSAAEQMSQLRALPNGPVILLAAEQRGIIIINSRSNTPSGSSTPAVAMRSGHLAQSPSSGSGGSGSGVHGSQPVGSTSSGTSNNGHTALPASSGSSGGSSSSGNTLVPLPTSQVVGPSSSMSAHWQGGTATLMVQGLVQPDRSVVITPMTTPPSGGGSTVDQASAAVSQFFFGTPPGTPQPNAWLDVTVNSTGWYVVEFAVYAPKVTISGLPSYATLHLLQIKAPGTQTVTCDDKVLAVTKNGLSSCMALVQLQAGKTTQITLINSGLPTMFVNASISSAVQ
jgi:Cobalamin biosynthesis protein CobN and related Mg-chelatases